MPSYVIEDDPVVASKFENKQIVQYDVFSYLAYEQELHSKILSKNHQLSQICDNCPLRVNELPSKLLTPSLVPRLPSPGYEKRAKTEGQGSLVEFKSRAPLPLHFRYSV